MLLDVPEELAPRIARTLGMTTVRARHVAATCERMAITLPYVVVIGGTPNADDVAHIREVALAISAQVVVLEEIGSNDRLELHLKSALLAASRIRRGAI